MRLWRSHSARIATQVLTCVVALALALTGCGGTGGGSGGGSGSSGDGETSGPALENAKIKLSPYDDAAATGQNGAYIDTSHVAQGYVAAKATSSSRLKFGVEAGGSTYYYDMKSGKAISCPLSLGNGSYTFTVYENTSGSSYATLYSTSATVKLESEFTPFERPNVYCNYTKKSACVKKAAELAKGAENEGDVIRAVYSYIANNISYDNDKAEKLKDGSGYIPDPDDTLESGTGVCFDYASLAAAMLRSQGIPCQIITGTVGEDALYHAWNMVYTNGSWVSAKIEIKQDEWNRIDLTFAAAGSGTNTGTGEDYVERYTY